MLILKLTIVPLGLLVFGIIERLHGPRVAGWLAGFPDRGRAVAAVHHPGSWHARSAPGGAGRLFRAGALAAFTMTYAFCARRLNWLWCAVIGFAVWTAGGAGRCGDAGTVALAGNRAVCRAFWARCSSIRAAQPSDEEREHVWWGLPARMVAGAGLTIVITQFAGVMGSRWSGLFSTFPVMGSIICISSHLQYGRHAVQEAVAGMTLGLASVGTFCFVLYVLLGMMAMWPAFGLALVTPPPPMP